MLKPNLLALAVASVLASGTLAHADDGSAGGTPYASGAAQQGADTAADQAAAPGKEGEDKNTVNLNEIKVTGIRGGIEQAISVKLNSNEIVEAISAEDIGKLPDNSIAESLARLPGITAQRVGGRASTLSIRGFSGDFNGTLLNGREQVSTGDNRAIEFDQYPSELLSGVVVYKTPEASLIGQGISGTVDMQSVRPLDFNHRVVQLGARGEHNSNGAINPDTDDNGYRVNASYIDQYMDNTLGLAIGYARLKSPVQDKRFESWGYPTVNVNGQNVTALGGFKIYPDSIEGTRDAIMGTLEWRPNDQFTSTLDIYYSKFNQDTIFRGLEAGLVWGSGTTLTNPIVSNGELVGGTWTGVKPVVRDELDHHDDKIREIGWNNKFHFADSWTAVADLSYGKANSKQSLLEQYAGTIPGSPNATDTWNFTINPSTGVPTIQPGINYEDPNIIKLVDSGGWGQDGYLKFPKTSDELKVGRIDVSRDINGPFSKFQFGFNWNDRTKTRISPEYLLDLPGGPSGVSADVPSNCITGPVDLSLVGIPGALSWDDNCVMSQYVLTEKKHQDITNKDWTVEEKVKTSYFMFDIDTEMAGQPLRGNIGAQYVNVEQNSDAFKVGAQDAVNQSTTTHGGANYGNLLPSLNLAWTLPMDNVLRFGAGREVARPRMDYMRASTEFNLVDVTGGGANSHAPTVPCTVNGEPGTCQWQGSGGNPHLRPFIANAYDLAWEKYWETKAYISAAIFYKKLESYVYNIDVPYDFTGIPNPTLDSDKVLIPSGYTGVFNQPRNGTGGYIRGYELTASMPLEVIWAPLEGFGVQASYGDTESSIHLNGPTDTSPFPGLSKYVFNATVYYEKAGFSARVAERHRSDFLGEVQGFGADRSFRNVQAESVVDVQLGYKFDEGMFKGLGILFQVNNATDEPYREYYGTRSNVQQYTLYGRQYLLGVTYKF
jgi:iron complex outermembrane receptor protein